MRGWAALLLVALAGIPAGAAAQTADDVAAIDAPRHVQERAEALAQDAAEYARQFNLSIEDATRRLKAQEKSVDRTDKIADKYRDRLAGIAIEHSPDYRIVVSLTGDAPVEEQHFTVDGLRVPIVFQTGAKATRDQVIWAITYHQNELRKLLPSPAMGLDPRSGELVVVIDNSVAEKEGAQKLEARLEAVTHVPVRVQVTDRVYKNLEIQGGSRLEGVNPDNGKRYYCTTAFAVTDGSRNAITTAAHCLDTMTYLDPKRTTTPLEFVGQWGWGYQDVQLNVANDTLEPLIYADSAKTLARPITGERSRTSTRAGEFVCHRGETTGYSCAVVELTDFAPAGDLCGGACLPTWVAVRGPGCKGGDSGSPVFSGTVAFGILKGASYRKDGSCDFYFYMSTDYLPPGWKLMTD